MGEYIIKNIIKEGLSIFLIINFILIGYTTAWVGIIYPKWFVDYSMWGAAIGVFYHFSALIVKGVALYLNIRSGTPLNLTKPE